MKVDQLANMRLKDLLALRERLDEAIVVRQREERNELKAKLTEIALQSGFSVVELFGGKDKRSSVAPKYRNPRDPSQTWTGRGRRPLWIAQAGGDLERFRI